MSILIKDMEIPEGCSALTLKVWPDGQVEIFDADGEWKTSKAIPVPPHGRLIDADALIERMFDQLVAKTMMFGGQYVYTKEEINNAPTVIPSDKDGEA